MMTLDRLAAEAPRIVGLRPDPRWRRSSEHFVRSDGVSRKMWFERNPAGARVRCVRKALLEGAPWNRLVRIHLPKYGANDTRPIDIPTIVDQARLYLLQDWMREYAERRSEAAFAQLVRRHVDLIYSAALQRIHARRIGRVEARRQACNQQGDPPRGGDG